jgi:hypothetical protein
MWISSYFLLIPVGLFEMGLNVLDEEQALLEGLLFVVRIRAQLILPMRFKSSREFTRSSNPIMGPSYVSNLLDIRISRDYFRQTQSNLSLGERVVMRKLFGSL